MISYSWLNNFLVHEIHIDFSDIFSDILSRDKHIQYRCFTSSWAAADIFTNPGWPLLSILLAIFTVLPQISYAYFFLPTTPATAGPTCMPIRNSQDWSPASILSLIHRFHPIPDFQAGLDNIHRVIGIFSRNSTGAHIRVSDGFYFFKIILFYDIVKRNKTGV